MKKKVFALALAAISMANITALAQDNDRCTPPPACCRAAFDGLDLSDAQLAQLKTLRENGNKARETQMRATMAERQRIDSVSIAERKAAKRQYLHDVRDIIGPDRYVTYLENIVVNADSRHHGKEMRPGRRHAGKARVGKGLRHGNRAPETRPQQTR